MLTRTIALFSLCVAAALFSASRTEAQPGKGKGPKGFGKGPFGGGPDVKKLEAEVDRLRAQVKELEENLARARESARPKSPFEGKGKEKFDFKKKDFGKEMGKPGFPPFAGKGKGGFGRGFGKGKGGGFGDASLNPEMLKERYEFYKKLYDESRREAPKGKDKGFEKKFGPKEFGNKKFESKRFESKKESDRPADSIEARLDRLTREIEELRNELHKKKSR